MFSGKLFNKSGYLITGEMCNIYNDFSKYKFDMESKIICREKEWIFLWRSGLGGYNGWPVSGIGKPDASVFSGLMP